jgi:hypothetical protein
MLELGAGVENVKKCEPGENINDEFSDISFEELLAQEKKDSFWLVLFRFFPPCIF